MGKDLIVISFIDRVVEDLGSAFKSIEDKSEGEMHEFTEIIAPSKQIEGQDFTPENPQIILFFIQ